MAKATAATAPAKETVTTPEPEAASPDKAPETGDDFGSLAALIGERLDGVVKPREEARPPKGADDVPSQTGNEPPAEPAEAADAGGNDEAEGTEPEPAAEGDEEPKGLTPEAQHAFNKRIAREVERRKEIEAERDEALQAAQRTEALEAELAGLREQLARPDDSAEHPWLAKADDAPKLERAESDARKYLRWAERQLDKLKFKPADVEAALKAENAKLEEFSDEAMGDYLLRVKENAQDVLDAVPQKRQRLEGRKAFSARERQVLDQFKPALPWLADRKSDGWAQAEQIATRIPGLKALPEWPVLAAMLSEGGKVLDARLRKPGAPAPAAARKPAASPAKPAAEPAPVNPARARRETATRQALESGSEIDIARAIEARLS